MSAPAAASCLCSCAGAAESGGSSRGGSHLGGLGKEHMQHWNASTRTTASSTVNAITTLACACWAGGRASASCARRAGEASGCINARASRTTRSRGRDRGCGTGGGSSRSSSSERIA